ncbi:winged helix DNA-binding domain-containing protein [Rhizoclosmatium globosum]|uniref:Winged helix DNA-binding domain-containing protein n=1 Tax=Rhizoclosmatium globosum TaxID=329046 RepID=A0A1Y2CCE8_9FUNG|nr:winged helix DNA-binding domain-containing protein [Rhizoclosmatium globosum]|eukprot:ORY43995.1 winged helix DNA-binding domain-containing protein [Rhizoclosmatium globosum]
MLEELMKHQPSNPSHPSTDQMHHVQPSLSVTPATEPLVVLLGRKIAQGDSVDVHLGSIKSISRSHARIQFNFGIQNFEIVVLGKNGAIVDGNYVGPNSMPVPLYNKSRIIFGEIECQFLLPKSESTATTMKSTMTESRRNTSHNPQNTKPKTTPYEDSNGSAKNEESEFPRPTISYAAMITQAILASPERRMTLAEIYAWIIDKYPLNRAFKKVAREEAGGKGGWWTVDPDIGDEIPSTRRSRHENNKEKEKEKQ